MAATTISPVMVTSVPPTFPGAVMSQNVAMPQSSMVMPQVPMMTTQGAMAVPLTVMPPMTMIPTMTPTTTVQQVVPDGYR